MSYPGAIKSLGPLAYYRLGEASGDALDSSGNGRHGASDGAWTRAVAGLLPGDPDKAVADTGGGQFIVPYGAWMNQASFTIVALSSPTGSATTRTILGRYAGGFGASAFALRWDNDDKLGFYVFENAAYHLVKSSPTYGATARHHVAATCSPTAIKVFVEGVQVGATTETIIPNTSTNNMYIGASAGTEVYTGDLDEIAFYGSVLSDADIARLYRESLRGGVRY